MSRPRLNRVGAYSCQGYLMKHLNRFDAMALVEDICSGWVLAKDENGRDCIQLRDYAKSREESPTAITVADMKLNAGEFGDPLPIDLRRDGYIDPIESARDKIGAWTDPDITDAKRDVLVAVAPEVLHQGREQLLLCTWPRDPYYMNLEALRS
jgi:hypothetical protein